MKKELMQQRVNNLCHYTHDMFGQSIMRLIACSTISFSSDAEFCLIFFSGLRNKVIQSSFSLSIISSNWKEYYILPFLYLPQVIKIFISYDCSKLYSENNRKLII